MTGFEAALAAAGALLLLGVVASKVAGRLGVPALLLFIGVGMVAGGEGVGGIVFTDTELARNVGVLALAFILFSGGLDTRWATVRAVVLPGAALATVAVVLSAAVVGVAAAWVLDVPLATGLLLGALVSSTDAAAVFSVLRTHSVGLRHPIRPLLEFESGSNDPMAVFLTVALLAVVTGDASSIGAFIPMFVLQMGVGALGGLVMARVGLMLLNQLRLREEGLYPVLTIALVVLTYGLTAFVGGSGFLAVYIAGVVMGNSHFVHERSLMRFHDALAWLMQIVMFLLLGLLVAPSQLLEVAGRGIVIAAVLILLARPFAVVVTLLPFRLGWRAVAMTSWVGLRGAVPVILALFPLVEGTEHAGLLFNVVFFVVLLSVLVQGTTIPFAARLVGVDSPLPPRPAYPIEATTSPDSPTDLRDVWIPEGSAVEGRRIFELQLPEGTLIVLVDRGGTVLIPRGATELRCGDKLMVLADDESLREIEALVQPG